MFNIFEESFRHSGAIPLMVTWGQHITQFMCNSPWTKWFYETYWTIPTNTRWSVARVDLNNICTFKHIFKTLNKTSASWPYRWLFRKSQGSHQTGAGLPPVHPIVDQWLYSYTSTFLFFIVSLLPPFLPSFPPFVLKCYSCQYCVSVHCTNWNPEVARLPFQD